MLYILGDQGPEISRFQKILLSEGFDIPNMRPGIFSLEMFKVVKYFQSTHLGPDKQQLEADGKIGDKTIYALEHATGEPQRLHLDGSVPKGLTPIRDASLNFKLAEWRKGVHEIPNGSNWSEDIKHYGGRRGWAWCALFGIWGWRMAGLDVPIMPSCHQAARWAQKNNFWYDHKSTDPRARIPGNAMIFYHSPSTGHFTTIVRVDVVGDTFNTVGGNEGNRVSFRIRHADEKELAGYINPFPADEQPIDFERGIVSAKSATGMTTR